MVLPAPFWPSSTVKLPGAIRKLTSRSAVRLPKLCDRRSTSSAARERGGSHGTTTTPQGACPTGTDRTTRIPAVSMTERSLLTPLVV